MREILFRGKVIGDSDYVGVWFVGDLDIMDYKPTIYDRENEVSEYVDENTIGQYTGAKDKDGVKIFEGDIVDFRCPYGKLRGKVVYNEQEACFCVEYHNNIIELTPYNIKTPSIDLVFENEYIPMCNCSKYAVLGNIYDDKDKKY